MISVCLIIDDYYLNRESIQTMLKNCAETEIELLVVNNTFDGKCSEYINQIIKDDKFYNVLRVGEVDEITPNTASAYNKLFAEAKGDYICVFDASATVGKNWLYDLLYYHTLIAKCGIAAIPEFNAKKEYAPLMDKNDEFVHVWKPKENFVTGILFFKKETLKQVGCFTS